MRGRGEFLREEYGERYAYVTFDDPLERAPADLAEALCRGGYPVPALHP